MRLIDADHLKESIRYGLVEGVMYERLVDKEPTIDPVKHTHWIEENTVMAKFVKCSNCGIHIRVAREGKQNERYYLYSDEMKFCSNCGAKMDEVTE